MGREGVVEVLGGETPSVEFVMLAEYVEVIHGKLYVMGGAWETITVGNFDMPVTLSLAISILVPWLGTNRQHVVTLSVETGDGAVLAEQSRPVTVGRPANIEPGTSQRRLIATQLPVQLPGPDRYVIVAAIEGTPRARTAFQAAQGHIHG